MGRDQCLTNRDGGLSVSLLSVQDSCNRLFPSPNPNTSQTAPSPHKLTPCRQNASASICQRKKASRVMPAWLRTRGLGMKTLGRSFGSRERLSSAQRICPVRARVPMEKNKNHTHIERTLKRTVNPSRWILKRQASQNIDQANLNPKH